MTKTITQTPAQKLQGKTMPCGWNVEELIPIETGQTGSAFSIGYLANKDGEQAFLKALDFKKIMAMGLNDPLQAISYMTRSFEYERDILRSCRTRGLSKVIRSISDGTITVDEYLVPYIVFELASGDVRKESLKHAGFDLLWVLKTMHNICVGLKQLHGIDISHQDLKPSNILITENGAKKIGDFGTSVTKECTLPHAKAAIAGDRAYAAPEALYGYVPENWNDRRLGCDLFQLGSIFVFMITGIPASTLLISNLNVAHRPEAWSGSYQDVLPYLQDAFIRLIDTVENHLPDNNKDDILRIVKELCNPSVFKRGDPVLRRKNQNPFSLERYISRFDMLSIKVRHTFASEGAI